MSLLHGCIWLQLFKTKPILRIRLAILFLIFLSCLDVFLLFVWNLTRAPNEYLKRVFSNSTIYSCLSHSCCRTHEAFFINETTALGTIFNIIVPITLWRLKVFIERMKIQEIPMISSWNSWSLSRVFFCCFFTKPPSHCDKWFNSSRKSLRLIWTFILHSEAYLVSVTLQ